MPRQPAQRDRRSSAWARVPDAFACCAALASCTTSALAQVVQEPSAPLTPTETMEMVRRLSTHLLLVTLLGIVLFCALILVVLSRRRERARDRARELDRRIAKSSDGTPPLSAWEEAGRRMQVPRHDDRDEPLIREPSSWAKDDPADNESGARIIEGLQPATGTRPTVLVTGGSRRVGRAIVLEFARCGYDIAFTYHASERDAREVIDIVTQIGRQATAYRADLSRREEVEALADQLAQTLPRLDVLVHNAAVYERTPLSDLNVDAIEAHLRVNVVAPLVLTSRLRSLLAGSPMAGGGCVVAMLDAHVGTRPRKDFSAYMSSKAALGELVVSLAKELAPTVRVNGVAPGVVAWEEPPLGGPWDAPPEGNTPQGEGRPQGGVGGDGNEDTKGSGGPAQSPNNDDQRRYLRRVPLGRFGEPEDAAKAVRWLATEATYVTGQVLRVDGGRWFG